MELWSIMQASPCPTRKDELWHVLLPLFRCCSGAFHQCRRAQGNRQVLGHCAQPLLSQQRCYWHHGRWDEKSKQSAVELTKGSFAVQNTLGGYLHCSSGRPVYLMKQQPSSFRVICTFCQQNVFSIPIFAFIVIPPEVCMQDK